MLLALATAKADARELVHGLAMESVDNARQNTNYYADIDPIM